MTFLRHQMLGLEQETEFNWAVVVFMFPVPLLIPQLMFRFFKSFSYVKKFERHCYDNIIFYSCYVV